MLALVVATAAAILAARLVTRFAGVGFGAGFAVGFAAGFVVGLVAIETALGLFLLPIGGRGGDLGALKETALAVGFLVRIGRLGTVSAVEGPPASSSTGLVDLVVRAIFRD